MHRVSKNQILLFLYIEGELSNVVESSKILIQDIDKFKNDILIFYLNNNISFKSLINKCNDILKINTKEDFDIYDLLNKNSFKNLLI